MNIFLHQRHLVLLLLCLFSLPLLGQVEEAIETRPGEAVDYSFFHYRGFPIGLGTVSEPSNGTLTGPVLQEGTEIFKYTYLPNDGFLGEDAFSFTRLNCFYPGSCIDTVTVRITVRQALVTAEQDIAFAMMDADAIRIKVTENDFSESGVLELLNIPMVNNGTAEINSDGTISFTPNRGFEGIASFNYNVCNEFGICDLATVNVVVNDVSPGSSDTLRIFTSINEGIPILTPADYTLTRKPEYGYFDPTNSVPQYYPRDGFTGKDYISFGYGKFAQTIEINVLNYSKNDYLVNDKAYVIPGRTVEIDVFDNDDLMGSPCLESIAQPKYGAIYLDPENPGVLTYRAPAGFVGLDEFTYSAFTNNCQGAAETATVSVFVSNYEPAASKFFMTTPKRTPLVIGYYVPITDFTFQIKQAPNHGEILYLEGPQDTLIYGRRITGNNLMLYIPSEGMNSGLDEFEITYCLSGPTNSRSLDRDATGCSFQKDVKLSIDILDIGNGEEPMCFGDCIWSGDTNFDGVVNLDDMLQVGLHMGEVGEERPEVNLNQWYGQYGDNWDLEADQMSKHVDTDGDSFISAGDTAAIAKFYGRTHSMTNAKIPTYDYKIYLRGTGRVRPGDMIELEVYIGNEDLPAIDLYGFTFNLPYNPRFFKPESMQIEFLPNSWITYNSPTLSMKHNNEKGLLATAFSRTNQSAISGFGKVAIMRGVVEDIITGIKDKEIEIDLGDAFGATAATGSGLTYGLNAAPFKLIIDLDKEEDDVAETDERISDQGNLSDGSNLILFPNPVKNRLNFHLNGGQLIRGIQIFDLNGRLIINHNRLESRSAQIEVAGLSEGLYIAKVQTDKGLITKKVKVFQANY